MSVNAVRQELRERGFSKTVILTAALAPGVIKQYDRDSDELKAGRRQFGVFNTINISNQSTADIVIRPDFAESREISVPAGIIIGKDQISFEEFEIRNVDAANTAAANTIRITFGFEPPLMRDHRHVTGARRG